MTIAASGILSGATDHHSHILPGVDDGVETMTEALRILATYEALGIKELWLTPHIMEDCPNSPQKLRARFEELKAAYNGSVELHLAAEYMIDNHLREQLKRLRHSLEGAVQPEPSQETPPLFRGEVVKDRRGEEKTKECPTGAALGEGDKTTEPQEAKNSPSWGKREYPKGEGDEKNLNCQISPNKLRHSLEGRWHEQSEVTEGSNATEPQGVILPTNNCPSCVRGASNAVAEGDRPHEQESPLLPIGKSGKHILVETSYYNAPIKMRDTLQQIKSLGYHPLLAHPERYMYLNNAEYVKLHSEGVRFQLNLASLAGGYGKAVKKKAEWLLTNGFYTVAGSDLHCEDAIEFITKCKLNKPAIEQINVLLQNRI